MELVAKSMSKIIGNDMCKLSCKMAVLSQQG